MSLLTTRKLLPAKRYGLLVIDASIGFTDPKLSPLGASCEEVINGIASLIQLFRKLNLPIIYTTVAYGSDDEAWVFREKVPQLNTLKSSSDLHHIDPRVAPQKDEIVITKKWASAFFRTDLDAYLRQNDVDGIVITGLTTSGCVRASVVDAIQYGYKPIVVETAVGDRDQSAHEASLRDVSIKYGDVMTLEEGLKTVTTSTKNGATPS